MKLANVFEILGGLRLAIQHAFLPTLLAVYRMPALIFRPRAVSRIFFYHVWSVFGPGGDAHAHQCKTDLINPNADGVVLDIGAGLGHTALYLSSTRVTKYVALEPNTLMHPSIREMAVRAGFSEESKTLLILSCGAEDLPKISSALGGQNQADTIVSVMTFCTIPQPERTIQVLAESVLKPGGRLIFYEHVASKRRDVRFWQWFWSPIWKTCFDGCVLDRPTDDYIRRLHHVWETTHSGEDVGNRYGIWSPEGEVEENLWWHQMGCLVKRKA